MVLVELEYLHELERPRLPARDNLQKVAHETGLRFCDLLFPTIASSAPDERWPCDPFDRLMVANAKANGFASLVSAEEEIRKHSPRTVWQSPDGIKGTPAAGGAYLETPPGAK